MAKTVRVDSDFETRKGVYASFGVVKSQDSNVRIDFFNVDRTDEDVLEGILSSRVYMGLNEFANFIETANEYLKSISGGVEGEQ